MFENIYCVLYFAAKPSQIYETTWLPIIFLSTFLPYFSYLTTLGTKNVQNFMRKKDLHFDLVIHEEVYHDGFLIFGEISAIFKDNVVHPMDEFIWWVEHVIKFRGANYLKSHAIDMPFFTYLLLDVWLVKLIVVTVVLSILYSFFRKYLCKKKNVGTKTKQE